MAGNGYKVGVLGATGLVGTTIRELLAAREFPVAELVPLASERSAGKELAWNGGSVTCRALDEDSIQGLDIVLSSAGGSVSAEWTPRLVEAGAVVVDNTSYWRMHDDVPLVVAEVNPEALGDHRGIVANPNCSTMQMVVALKPLFDAAGIERLVISTYQAVSGTGKAAIDELREQARAVLDGAPAEARIYPHQIAFNALAQAGSFAAGDDHTDEERKLINETRKILGDPEIKVSATCVRVPVVTGHSEAVNVETREPLSPERARELLAAAPGVTVADDPGAGVYPMATEAAGRDDVFVGRIRRDPGNERALDLFVVADNLRKGAATNAVQVAELLHERGLVGSHTRARAGSAA
jgi:aspartate-semialdehyde dehydrogenase